MAKSDIYKAVPSYVKNVAKSTAYSMKKAISMMTPAMSEFANSNAELAKDIVNDIKNYKNVVKTAASNIDKSQTMQTVKEIKKNALEDLKTGKIYNVERDAEYTMKAFGFDQLFDMSGLDDFDLGDPETDVDAGSDHVAKAVTMNNIASTRTMVGAVTDIGTRVINSNIHSADYIVANQKALHSVQMVTNYRLFEEANTHLSNISNNIKGLFDYTANITDYMQKSFKYYDESVTVMKEMSALNKEMTEMYRNLYGAAKTNPTPQENPLDMLFGASGGLNIKEYMNHIKKNAKNVWEESGGGMLNMMGSDSNPLMALAGSPLSFLSTYMAGKAIPKNLKKSLGNLDKTFENFFKSALLKVSSKGRQSDNPFMEIFGKVFGLEPDSVASIKTDSYTKGPMPFDGITKQAIVEVIPTYLRKILAALTSTNEKIYNYEKGKFQDHNQIRKEYDDEIEYSYNGMRDTKNKMKQQLQSVVFKEGDSRKKMDSDLNSFVRFLSDYGYFFNPHKMKDYEDIRSKGLYLDGGADSYKMLLAAYSNLDRQSKLKTNSDIYDTRKRRKGVVEDINKELYRKGFSSLENDSKIDESYTANSVGIRGPVDKYNKSSTDYLRDIRTILLEGIKVYSFSMGKGAPSQGNYTFINDRLNNYREEVRDLRAASYVASRSTVQTDYDDATANTKAKNIKGIVADTLQSITGLPIDRLQTVMRDSVKNLAPDPNAADQNVLQRAVSQSRLSSSFERIKNFSINAFNAPGNAIAKVVDQVDSRMYEMIYGKGTANEGDPNKKSFINELFNTIKTKSIEMGNWIHDKILDPLSEKLFGKDGIITKMQAKIMPKLRAGLDSTMNWLFGSKNNAGDRVGGLIPDVRDTFLDIGGHLRNFITGRGFKSKLTGASIADNKENVFSIMKSSAKSLGTYIGNVLFGEKHTELGEDWESTGASRTYRKGGILSSFVRTLGNTFKGISTTLFGTEDFAGGAKQFYNDKVKKYVPKAVAGSIAGGALGLFTPFGLIGGMMLGGGISTAASSERFKKWAFGDENTEGKLVSKKSMDKIKKFAPKAAAGGALGAIASLVTPFGFVGGTLAGGAISVLSASDKFKNWAFGEIVEGARQGGKLIPKGTIEVVKKFLPNAAVGGLTGKMLSIVGLSGIPGAGLLLPILGTGIGIASSSEKFKEWAFGAIGDDGMRNGGKLLSGVAIRELKKAVPKMALGGIAGKMLSFTKMSIPGGGLLLPLLGAGIGFAASSEKFKTWAFGDETKDGKIMSNKTFQELKKVLPGTLGGALAGSIMGVPMMKMLGLPNILGIGSLAMPMLGASIGFAATSERFKKWAFGDDTHDGKLLNKAQVENIKKKLPIGVAGMVSANFLQTGLGALGSFLLPGGPIGASLIGLAVGIGSQSDRVKSYLFGKEDPDTQKRSGGLFGRFKTWFKTEVQAPMQIAAAGMKEHTKFWFTKYLLNPIKDVADSGKEAIKIFASSVKETFGNIFGGFKDTIGAAFDRAVATPMMTMIQQKIVDPMKKVTSRLFGGISKFLGNILASPLNLMNNLMMGYLKDKDTDIYKAIKEKQAKRRSQTDKDIKEAREKQKKAKEEYNKNVRDKIRRANYTVTEKLQSDMNDKLSALNTTTGDGFGNLRDVLDKIYNVFAPARTKFKTGMTSDNMQGTQTSMFDEPEQPKSKPNKVNTQNIVKNPKFKGKINADAARSATSGKRDYTSDDAKWKHKYGVDFDTMDDAKPVTLGSLFKLVMKAIPGAAIGATTAGLARAVIGAGIPGGPMSVLLIGSALGIVARSDRFKEFMFGPVKDGKRQGGLISKDIQQYIKKRLPKALGVAIGMNWFKGHLGLIGSAMTATGPLGAAIISMTAGIASQSDTFKNFFWGKTNPDTNKREGGIMGRFRTWLQVEVMAPFKFFKMKAKEARKHWLTTYITLPFKNLSESMSVAGKMLFKSAGEGIKNIFGTAKNKFKDSWLGKRLGKILDPLEKFFGWFTSKVTTFMKKFNPLNIIGTLFKGVGAGISALPKLLNQGALKFIEKRDSGLAQRIRDRQKARKEEKDKKYAERMGTVAAAEKQYKDNVQATARKYGYNNANPEVKKALFDIETIRDVNKEGFADLGNKLEAIINLLKPKGKAPESGTTPGPVNEPTPDPNGQISMFDAPASSNEPKPINESHDAQSNDPANRRPGLWARMKNKFGNMMQSQGVQNAKGKISQMKAGYSAWKQGVDNKLAPMKAGINKFLGWHAEGAVINSPSLIGVGEAGPEAVFPLKKLPSMMAQAIDRSKVADYLKDLSKGQKPSTGGVRKDVNFVRAKLEEAKNKIRMAKREKLEDEANVATKGTHGLMNKVFGKTSFLGKIFTFLLPALPKVFGFFKGLFNFIKNPLGGIKDLLFGGKGAKGGGLLGKLFDGLKKVGSSIFTKLKGWLSPVWTTIKKFGAKLLTGATKLVSQIIAKLGQIGTKIASAIGLSRGGATTAGMADDVAAMGMDALSGAGGKRKGKITRAGKNVKVKGKVNRAQLKSATGKRGVSTKQITAAGGVKPRATGNKVVKPNPGTVRVAGKGKRPARGRGRFGGLKSGAMALMGTYGTDMAINSLMGGSGSAEPEYEEMIDEEGNVYYEEIAQAAPPSMVETLAENVAYTAAYEGGGKAVTKATEKVAVNAAQKAATKTTTKAITTVATETAAKAGAKAVTKSVVKAGAKKAGKAGLLLAGLGLASDAANGKLSSSLFGDGENRGMVQDLGATAFEAAGYEVKQKVKKKIATKAAEAIVEHGGDLMGMITKAFSSEAAQKAIKKFPHILGPLKTFLVEKVGKLGGTAIKKMIGKLTVKLGAHAAAASSTLGIANVLMVAGDLVMGLVDTRKIFAVPPGSPVNLKMRLISAVVKFLENNITFGIIPSDAIATFIYNLISGPEDEAELKRQQEAMMAEWEKYKAETGEDISFEEFNATKNANFLDKAWDWTKKGLKAGWEGIKWVGGKIADGAAWVGDKAVSAWNGTKSLVKSGAKAVTEFGSAAVNTVKDAGSKAVSAVTDGAKAVGKGIAGFFGFGGKEEKKEEKREYTAEEKAAAKKKLIADLAKKQQAGTQFNFMDKMLAKANNIDLTKPIEMPAESDKKSVNLDRIKSIGGSFAKKGSELLNKMTGGLSSKAFDFGKNLLGDAKTMLDKQMGGMLGLTDKDGNPVGVSEAAKNGTLNKDDATKGVGASLNKIKSMSTGFWKSTQDKMGKMFGTFNSEGMQKGAQMIDTLFGAFMGARDANGRPVGLTQSGLWQKGSKFISGTLGKLPSSLSSVWDKLKNNHSTTNQYTAGTTSFLSSGGQIGGGYGARNLTDSDGSTSTSAISSSDYKNNFVYYSQSDPRWANHPYGPPEGKTVSSSGCGPTSAAMVISSLNKTMVTPSQAADFAKARGHRVPNAGTSWGFFTDFGRQHGIDFQEGGTDANTILTSLKDHKPVILSGNGSAPFTTGGHFVVATGISSDGSKITINDPVSSARSIDYSTPDILGKIKASFIASKNGQGMTGMPTMNNIPGSGGAITDGEDSIAAALAKIGDLTMGFADSTLRGDVFDPSKILEPNTAEKGAAVDLNTGTFNLTPGQPTPFDASVSTMKYIGTTDKGNPLYSGDKRNLNVTPEQFISIVAPQAMKNQRELGIPASTTIAQAALESGWGKDTILNNMFGIKEGSKYKGSVIQVNTSEYDDNGKKYATTAKFRGYTGLMQAIEDHGKNVIKANPQYYSRVINDNWENSIDGLRPSYATDPNYTELLKSIVRQRDLMKYNTMAEQGDFNYGEGTGETQTTTPPVTPKVMDKSQISEFMKTSLRKITARVDDTLTTDRLVKEGTLSSDYNMIVQLLSRIADNTDEIKDNTEEIANKEFTCKVESIEQNKNGEQPSREVIIQTPTGGGGSTSPFASISNADPSTAKIKRSYDLAKKLALGIKN